MKISTKGRYCLKIMLDICSNNYSEYIPLKDIAKRQNISEKYLESIIKLLVKNNLLIGLRGKGGGYKLTKSVENYTVGEIIRISEDIFTPSSFPTGADKDDKLEIKILEMWIELDKVIDTYLNNVSLADLLSQNSGNDFVI